MSVSLLRDESIPGEIKKCIEPLVCNIRIKLYTLYYVYFSTDAIYSILLKSHTPH